MKYFVFCIVINIFGNIIFFVYFSYIKSIFWGKYIRFYMTSLNCIENLILFNCFVFVFIVLFISFRIIIFVVIYMCMCLYIVFVCLYIYF